MSIWSGIDNGVPTADMDPGQLAPTMRRPAAMAALGHALSVRTATQGEAPDLPEAVELVELCSKQWRQSTDRSTERAAIWHEDAGDLHRAGLLDRHRQRHAAAGPARRRGCSNVPEKALYGFDPTAYLGVYMPDTFWFGRRT